MKKVVALIVIAIVAQSCIFLAAPAAKSAANKNLTVEKNAIPAAIGMNGTYVVCLLQERESRDKYLRQHFNEHYNGKFVFSTLKELDGQYADKSKYRYVFTYTKLSGGAYHVSDGSTTPMASSNYFIYDRVDDKEYNSGFHSSMFGKVIEAYAKNMEKQRLANLERP